MRHQHNVSTTISSTHEQPAQRKACSCFVKGTTRREKKRECWKCRKFRYLAYNCRNKKKRKKEKREKPQNKYEALVSRIIRSREREKSVIR